MSFIIQSTDLMKLKNMWAAQISWDGGVYDDYMQWILVSSPAQEVFWSVPEVILEVKKNGGKFVGHRYLGWGMGTVIGSKTWFRAHSLLQSIKDLEVFPLPQMGVANVYSSVSFEDLFDAGVWEIRWTIAVLPFVYETWAITMIYNPSEQDIIEKNLVQNKKHHGYYAWKRKVDEGRTPPTTPPHRYGQLLIVSSSLDAMLVVGISFVEGEDAPQTGIFSDDSWPKAYRLHHVIKQGAEISPPDGTVLFEGYSVPITAWPLGGRTLTSFTVQDVEQLPDASSDNYPDLHAKGIDASELIKDGQAQMTYGPIHSDVYVSAIADAFEISEPCPVTIQLTTNDCLVEAGSWEVVDNNLPDGVTYTLSQDGLMEFSVAEDKWDGIAGGVYFVHVRFNGFKQTKDMKVVVTVSPFPAYGTVWTPVTLLDEDINDIFLASDGKTYIVGQTKIWSTTDLTNFTVETLSGTLDTKFGNMGEASAQRICACDKTGYWIKDVGNGSTEFVRQGDWPAPGGYLTPNYYMSADPDTSEIYVGFGVAYGGVIGVDLDTSNQLGPYQVITGLNGWVSTKGLYNKADDSWIFAGGKTNGYNIVQLKNGIITQVVPNSTAYGNSEPNIYREISGRMIALVEVAQNQLNSMYSDDDGVTWSTPVSFTAATPRRATYLKPGYSVFGGAADVYRSTDNLASATDVATLDGTLISSFCRLADFKILAGTNGTTHNLYKSEA